MMFSMRTTLDLPDPLFKAVKTRAVQQGVKLKDLLASYIEAGLRAPLRPETSSGVGHNPHSLPVAWVADGTATPARTNAELFGILDDDDVEDFHRISQRPPV
jgi:hypothetical protein